MAFLTSSNSHKRLHILTLFTIELADLNDLYTKLFVYVSPTDFCKFDLVNTPTKPLIAKNVNLDIYKICTFLAFEAKLLEIEAEDTIRLLHYVQVLSIQKRLVKEKYRSSA